MIASVDTGVSKSFNFVFDFNFSQSISHVFSTMRLDGRNPRKILRRPIQLRPPNRFAMQGPVTTCQSFEKESAKLRSYVILASIDGFVVRIDNEHLENTIQTSWVLWGRVRLISLCFLQKNQDLRQCFN